jgi:hypothetical protein
MTPRGAEDGGRDATGHAGVVGGVRAKSLRSRCRPPIKRIG